MRELLSTGLIVASAVVLGLLVFTLGKHRTARGGEGGQTTAARARQRLASVPCRAPNPYHSARKLSAALSKAATSLVSASFVTSQTSL